MNEEILFNWDRESVEKCIWKNWYIKVKVTVYSPNSTKIWWFCWRCSQHPVASNVVNGESPYFGVYGWHSFEWLGITGSIWC